MTKEEKYKEALLEARAVLEPCLKYSNGKVREALDSIDKELKSFESEDEKIIDGFRTLLDGIKRSQGLTLNKVPLDKCYSWLEKQKEQKPVQDKEEKEYVRTLKSLIADFLHGKNEIDRGYYQKIYDWLDGRHIKQEPEWSEEDYIKQRALIDTLRGETTCFTTTDFISWLKAIPLNRKKHNEDVAKRCSNEWSEEDERLYKCVLKTLELWAEGKLYQYIIPSNTDRYINFFKSLKFRVQPQSKQEWSKKDEEMLWNIISIVGQSKSIKADEMLDWLKSLRPSWKPSEEQMDALEAATVRYQSTGLESLYEELKKL